MNADDFRPGHVVRVIVEHEQFTGTHLAVLMTGHVADRPVVACALRQIIPVELEVDGETRVLWVSDDQVLSVSGHPTGGLP